MITKKYGVVGFIGNKTIARLRFSNELFPKIKMKLTLLGIVDGVDYTKEIITSKHTTITVILPPTILNQIKIETRKHRIINIQNEINQLRMLQ
jgi:hypothetical protein